jgi:hypothetical protein
MAGNLNSYSGIVPHVNQMGGIKEIFYFAHYLINLASD